MMEEEVEMEVEAEVQMWRCWAVEGQAEGQ